MPVVRRTLFGIALFHAVSTVIGFVQLLAWPQLYAPALDGTIFAGRYALAALLLGVLVGGVQWCAVVVQRRRSRWYLTVHAAAGTVMLGWIAGECLVLNQFIWPHALWGGLGACQVLLVCLRLGVLRGEPEAAWARTGSGAATATR